MSDTMSLVLTLQDADDPYEHLAKAVQRDHARWDVEYFRGAVLVSDGMIGTPTPHAPPVATLIATLAQLRQEADHWASRT